MEGKQRKKEPWTAEEDRILMDYVRVHGKGRWSRIPKTTGLKRGGRSCRLRWMNYLCPTVKHEHFTQEEEDLIIRLHNLLGNRWSLIAGRIPGRTDNQVKNHWNTHLRKKLKSSFSIASAGQEKQNPNAGEAVLNGAAKQRPRLIERNNNTESGIAAGTSSPPPKAITQGTSLPFEAAAKDPTSGRPLPMEEAPEKDGAIATEFYEQLVGDYWYGSRYWPSDDGVLGDLHTPSLMEPVDGYSLDSFTVWDLNSTDHL